MKIKVTERNWYYTFLLLLWGIFIKVYNSFNIFTAIATLLVTTGLIFSFEIKGDKNERMEKTRLELT
jgi:hypothetical protein